METSSTGKAPVLVDTDWLKANLGIPGIVVLHITTTRADYANGHIPGALFLWTGDIIISTPAESTVPAPVKEAANKLRQLGIDNNSHVIIYGRNSNYVQVCRIFVSLEHYGLKGKVSILEGGFEEWKDAGNETEKGIPEQLKGKFRPSVLPNLVTGEFVNSKIQNGSFLIFDARARAQYDGSESDARSGHIPGAVSLPQADVFDAKTYRFATTEAIKQSFEKSGLTTGKIPIVYCNTGNSASVLYVAARIAGFEPLLYDGSMEEWSNNLFLPLEKKQVTSPQSPGDR